MYVYTYTRKQVRWIGIISVCTYICICGCDRKYPPANPTSWVNLQVGPRLATRMRGMPAGFGVWGLGFRVRV